MIKFQLKEGEVYSFKLKSDKGHTLLKSVGFENKTDLDVIVSKLNAMVNESTQFEAGMENGIKNLKNTIDFMNYRNQS